jgi:leader peptidase (prepilin peptidase)/N-methyltransferase
MILITAFQQNPLFFYFVAAILGLLVGSFLNVVIYRLPKMMEREWQRECRLLLEIDQPESSEEDFNLVFPGSSCPHCKHKISALENIPVISYLFLKGRCRQCNEKISLRYPLIEIASCMLTVLLAIHFGVTYQVLLAMLFTWSLLAMSVIDYDHKILPDDITLPMLWLGIIANMFGIFTDIQSSLYGAIFGYLSLWLVYILFKVFTGKEGMGFGDFKLLAMLGAWLGWQFLPLIIIASSLFGTFVGGGLILFKSHNRAQPIPFGPYLALAGFISLLYGQELINFYLNWALS